MNEFREDFFEQMNIRKMSLNLIAHQKDINLLVRELKQETNVPRMQEDGNRR